jgi:sulfhydrogenase subunit beta (sulfur reductase)
MRESGGVHADPGRPLVIDRDDLDQLIRVLAGHGYRVVGPTVRDGAIVLDDVSGVADLPAGWGDEQDAGRYRLRRRDDDALFGFAVGPQSARRFLAPPRRTLWSADLHAGGFTVRPPPPEAQPVAILGARGCDLAAIAVYDAVVERSSGDPGYSTARRSAFVVGVDCGTPASTCFCTSMGTGPGVTSGHDIALTDLLDGPAPRYLARSGSDRGAAVLAELPATPASPADVDTATGVVAQAARRMQRRMDPHGARDALAAHPEHPRWDDVASRCLSCTNCTLVCPTCFCSTVEDVTSLAGDRAERVERWDSCFSLDHSYMHGGSVRADTRSRYRQWLTHKLSTWWDQFDTSGCVGCGRCIAWCPAAIDITAEAAAIAEEPA